MFKYLVLLMIVSLNAQADCSKMKSPMKENCECFQTMPDVDSSERACDADADCQLIPDKCGGWAAFNKSSVDKYKQLFAKIVIPTKVDAKKVSVSCAQKTCKVKIQASKH